MSTSDADRRAAVPYKAALLLTVAALAAAWWLSGRVPSRIPPAPIEANPDTERIPGNAAPREPAREPGDGAAMPRGYDPAKVHVSELLPAGYWRLPETALRDLFETMDDQPRALFIAETMSAFESSSYRNNGQEPSRDWQFPDLLLRFRFMGEAGLKLLTDTLNGIAGGGHRVTDVERDLAARLLMELADPRAAEGTIRYLDDSLNGVQTAFARERAAAALARAPVAASAPVFRRLVAELQEDDGRHLDTQRHAARGLAALGDEQGFWWLEREFDRRRGNSYQALKLVDSYATVNFPRADAFFRQLLVAPPVEDRQLGELLRRDALEFVQRRDDPAFLPLLDGLVADLAVSSANRQRAEQIARRIRAKGGAR